MRLRTALAVAIVGGILGTLTLPFPFTYVDSSVFTYVGEVILRGGVPYRDAWDVKAPGIFFFYALAQSMGKAPMSVRILEVFWQCATALVLGSIAVRIFSKQAAGVIAGLTYVLLYFSQDYWNLGQPDGLLSLPTTLAVWFALSALDRDRPILWGAAASCIGVAALFKMTMALFGVALLFAAILKFRHSLRHLLAALGSLAAGFAIPFVICGAYFVFHGALDDFLTAVLVAGPKYAASAWKYIDLNSIAFSLDRPIHIPLYVAGLLGLAGLVGRLRRGEALLAGEALLIAWTITALAGLVLHGKYFAYHFDPLFAPLAVLSAGPLGRVMGEFRVKSRPTVAAILVAALAALATVVPLKNVASHARGARLLRGAAPQDELHAVVDYIRARTAPGDFIFVWGSAPVIYLAAERDSSSRFINAAHVTELGDSLNFRPILLRELRANPPVCFVIMREPPKPVNSPWVPLDFDAELEKFALLKQFVDDQYYLDRRKERWSVYLRKSGGYKGGEHATPVRRPPSSDNIWAVSRQD